MSIGGGGGVALIFITVIHGRFPAGYVTKNGAALKELEMQRRELDVPASCIRFGWEVGLVRLTEGLLGSLFSEQRSGAERDCAHNELHCLVKSLNRPQLNSHTCTARSTGNGGTS